MAAGIPSTGRPGEIIYAPRGIEVCVGGHAANVSIDLVQLGQPDVAATGCIGEDVFGDYIEGELRGRGVEVYVERRTDFNTAKNLVLVVEGDDRRFFTEVAANAMLSASHVLSTLDDVGPSIFYLGTVGGLRLIDQNLIDVLAAARDRGCITFVDIIIPNEDGWRYLTSALPLIDMLHCNIRESTALTGVSEPGAAADLLLEEGVRLIMITMGSMGLIAATEDMKLKLPAFKVDTLDPTGAGDAFCAGVIHALPEDSSDPKRIFPLHSRVLKRILLQGAAAGAACVTTAGATTAVKRDIVDRLILEQGEDIMESMNIL